MMEKQGVINEENTPLENAEARDLEDHVCKRAADAAVEELADESKKKKCSGHCACKH